MCQAIYEYITPNCLLKSYMTVLYLLPFFTVEKSENQESLCKWLVVALRSK